MFRFNSTTLHYSSYLVFMYVAETPAKYYTKLNKLILFYYLTQKCIEENVENVRNVIRNDRRLLIVVN